MPALRPRGHKGRRPWDRMWRITANYAAMELNRSLTGGEETLTGFDATRTLDAQRDGWDEAS